MIHGVSSLPVLLLAAAGVGFGHAVMPDHWLPLAIMSRTRHYRTAKVARLSLAAAVAHVMVSLLLGGVVILVGLQFRATIADHTDLVVGSILLATGAVFLILDLSGKDHRHAHAHGQGRSTHRHDARDDDAHAPGGDDHQEHGPHEDGAPHRDDRSGHEHEHEHAGHRGGRTAVLDRSATQTRARGARGLAALLVPFGAAASPDLTILPVFLAASALGAGAALGSFAVFTVVTVLTIVGLTVAAALGARQFTAPWIDRSANLLTAATLLIIGALVIFGLI
jgi:ABC-type nickel/cobalt efflux system permease component RcnA